MGYFPPPTDKPEPGGIRVRFRQEPGFRSWDEYLVAIERAKIDLVIRDRARIRKLETALREIRDLGDGHYAGSVIRRIVADALAVRDT